MADLYCPDDDCGLPAIVTERFVLYSTDGPAPHARIECFAGHARLMMIEPEGEEDAA